MSDNTKERLHTYNSAEIKIQVDQFVDQCIKECIFEENPPHALTLPIPDFVRQFPTARQQNTMLKIIHLQLYEKGKILLNKAKCSELQYRCGCDRGFYVSANNFLFGEPFCKRNLYLEKEKASVIVNQSKKN